jgi:hypothetical protein
MGLLQPATAQFWLVESLSKEKKLLNLPVGRSIKIS